MPEMQPLLSDYPDGKALAKRRPWSTPSSNFGSHMPPTLFIHGELHPRPWPLHVPTQRTLSMVSSCTWLDAWMHAIYVLGPCWSRAAATLVKGSSHAGQGQQPRWSRAAAKLHWLVLWSEGM